MPGCSKPLFQAPSCQQLQQWLKAVVSDAMLPTDAAVAPRRRGRPPGRGRGRGRGRSLLRAPSNLGRESSVPSADPSSQPISPEVTPLSADEVSPCLPPMYKAWPVHSRLMSPLSKGKSDYRSSRSIPWAAHSSLTGRMGTAAAPLLPYFLPSSLQTRAQDRETS